MNFTHSSPNIFIKILQLMQLGVTSTACILTPIDQCIYGFLAFSIGCTYALTNLMINHHSSKLSENLAVNKEFPKPNIILSVMETIHDYIPLGFINMELHRLSSQYPLLSFVFTIPFTLDILSRLFDDGKVHVADEKVLLYLKKFNIIIHCISIGSLAKRELNIWFICVWLATMIISIVVLFEVSHFYVGKCIKLIGYILFYIFALIGISDDDFLRHLEWFNMHAMDYQ